MTAPNEKIMTSDPTFASDLVALARHKIGNRKILFLLACVALAAGATLNWSWLVAIGVAPLLLATAPCVAMCALGLCMRGDGHSRPSTGNNAGSDVHKDGA